MLWYVLQTKTGGEEKLVEMIRRMVPQRLYGECFVIYHEQLWRRQQQTFVHVKRAFPGYVFITSREAEALFFCLKKLPAMAKMMADEDFFFLSLDPKEAAFLQRIMDAQHVIGLSYLETDGEGKILQVSGPLSSCVSRIVCSKFGKRYVLVRLQLLGKEKEVLLGIILKEDICREIKYGKVEAPVKLPSKYKNREFMEDVKEYKNDKDGMGAGKAAKVYFIEKEKHCPGFSAGDAVMVSEGTFCGMSGTVYEMKDNVVKIGVQFLGRSVEMELPLESVRKTEKGRSGARYRTAEVGKDIELQEQGRT